MAEKYQLPLGKHKGVHFKEVADMDYLVWASNKMSGLSPELKSDITFYLLDNYKLKFGKFKDHSFIDIMQNKDGKSYIDWFVKNVDNENLVALALSIF